MIKKMSLKSRSLRPQLAIAFCSMSVIPILALFNFIFPSFVSREGLGIVVVSIAVLSLFGFFVIKKIIDSVIRLNADVQSMAAGELSRNISVSGEDEIGELSSAMNQLSHHIKDNMDELKIYGERTKDINLKINKQVIALSGVLQIGNLISEKIKLKDIFDISVSRLAQVTDSSIAFIVLEHQNSWEVVSNYGLKTDAVNAVKMASNGHIFRVLAMQRANAKDRGDKDKAPRGELMKLINANKILIHPLLAVGRTVGQLVIARQSGREYAQDDAELLDVFAKQMGIAVENDYLSKKVEDLEIRDSLTDLYNRRYILSRLDEEILRAISHQRPCAFIALKVNGITSLLERSGELAADDILRRVAEVLKNSLGEFDKAGRTSCDTFGLIFPERNKKQAQEMAQEIRKKIPQDVSVAVVENPIDGVDAATLVNKAEKALGTEAYT